MGKQRSGGTGPSAQQNANAKQLLDAVNRLADGTIMMAENMSELSDKLELVSTQFSVLIAAEAEKRNQPVQNMVEGLLKNLGEHAFRGGNRR